MLSETLAPHPDQLAKLPTLQTVTACRYYASVGDIELNWELKLARGDARWWLCTAGLPKNYSCKGKSFGKELFVGGVVETHRNPDGSWSVAVTYDADDLAVSTAGSAASGLRFNR